MPPTPNNYSLNHGGQQQSSQVGGKKRVAVVFGGESNERSLSLLDAENVRNALKEDYKVTLVDLGPNVASELQNLKPDIIFNATHGGNGGNGCLQGTLEILGIPYTHSGVRPNALVKDKQMSKLVVAGEGVPVAQSFVLPVRELLLLLKKGKHPTQPPYVIKPLNDGYSNGVIIVASDDEFPSLDEVESQLGSHNKVMIEDFAPGIELACGVLGDEALEVVEIRLDQGVAFFSTKAKDDVLYKLICPAPTIPREISEKIKEYSLIAHKAIGCRGVSRSDWKYDPESGRLIWLELNTQPGIIWKESPFAVEAEAEGLTYRELLEKLIQDASCGK